jgi:hypothetical protein
LSNRVSQFFSSGNAEWLEVDNKVLGSYECGSRTSQRK